MTMLLNIDVPSIEAAARFYTAAFDLKVGRRFGTYFIELVGWPVPVYLLTKERGRWERAYYYARHRTPIHPDIVVDDLDLAIARALAAGAILEHPAKEAPTEESLCLLIRLAMDSA